MFSVSPSAPRGACCVGSTQSPTLPIVHASQSARGPGHKHTHTHTHVRMRQNRPRKRNSREPPGRSFLLKSPQWFRTAGLFTAIWQVSLKCQEHLPTPNLHTHPLRGPYGETPWTLQGQPDRWPVPDLPSSGSDLHPALLLVLEPLLPAAFLESRS